MLAGRQNIKAEDIKTIGTLSIGDINLARHERLCVNSKKARFIEES